MSLNKALTESIQVAESENRFRNFIRQAPVGMIVLIGEEMRVEVVNEMYGMLVGRSPEELQNRNLFEVIPEAEEQFRSIIEGVRASGKSLYLNEHPYQVWNNQGRHDLATCGYLNLVYQPYREKGLITGVMVLCHDVTEQVTSRKQIQEAKEKLRLAIESAELGTYEFDLRSGETKVSDRFKEICNVKGQFSREALVNQIHPDDLPVRDQAHHESALTGRLFYEIRLVFGDEVRWIRVKGQLLFDEHNNPIAQIGVIQDITCHKDYADTLNQLVKERTEELQTLNEELAATNEELNEANDRLVSANRELEQFAYVASHDLQEPLRKIQIFSNLVKERFGQSVTPDAMAYVDKIGTSAARMAQLMKDLLDYSRLTHNKPLFQQIDLNLIVSNVLNDFELVIVQKKVSVRTAALPSIACIPIQMNQLFHNLIANSLKFFRKGVDPVITIDCAVLEQEQLLMHPKLKKQQKYFKFSVTDNGIGFSQQYAEQIFTIFQQLNEKSRFGGYGIGLSLCKRIVENHNGVIYANGIENEGATFTFILPENHN